MPLIVYFPPKWRHLAPAAPGSRIKDPSDYIDQSIPFVNYLSNLSGISLTGSVGSLPTGGGLDAQASAANKGRERA